jgi:hypothetical protein
VLREHKEQIQERKVQQEPKVPKVLKEPKVILVGL